MPRSGAAVTRYAGVILGQRRSSLPDVLQDAWTRVWAAWPPPEIERRDAWLFRIVRNATVAWNEHRRGRRSSVGLDELADVPAVDDPASDVVADDALRLLGTLPPALREALWLRAVEDRSYAEIAVGRCRPRRLAGRAVGAPRPAGNQRSGGGGGPRRPRAGAGRSPARSRRCW